MTEWITIFIAGAIGLMKLARGDKAPKFSATDVHGNSFSIEAALKNHNLAIFFLRYIGCAFCQVEIIEVKKKEGEFKRRNIYPVFVVNSERKVLKNYIEKKPELNFTFIPDVELNLYKLYHLNIDGGIKSIVSWNVLKKFLKFIWKDIKDYKGISKGLEGAHYLLPACFGINMDGIIVYSHYGKDITDGCKIDELLKAFSDNL